MKKFFSLFVLLMAFASVYPTRVFASAFKEPTAAEVSSAIETFRFRGQWIHPSIVKEFMPWESDYEIPLIASVDVSAATGTNRFFGDITYTDKDHLVPAYTSGEGEQISYKWEGRLKNGMHVITVRESGGGTMVSTSLLVFNLKDDTGTMENGKKYRRLLLQLERSVVLGDRATPKISIKGNKIEISSAFNNNRKSEQKTVSFE